MAHEENKCTILQDHYLLSFHYLVLKDWQYSNIHTSRWADSLIKATFLSLIEPIF